MIKKIIISIVCTTLTCQMLSMQKKPCGIKKSRSPLANMFHKQMLVWRKRAANLQVREQAHMAAITRYFRARDAILKERDTKMFIWAQHTSYSGSLDIKEELIKLYDALVTLKQMTRDEFQCAGYNTSVLEGDEVLTAAEVHRKFAESGQPKVRSA